MYVDAESKKEQIQLIIRGAIMLAVSFAGSCAGSYGRT